MREIPEISCIKGVVFSVYGDRGPEPKYIFPESILSNSDECDTNQNEGGAFRQSLRDIYQISIKSLSLLFTDNEISDYNYFGIIPFPDFRISSLVFFHFIKASFLERPIASTLSILIDENKRSFIYNNIERLKPFILEVVAEIDEKINNGYVDNKILEPTFLKLTNNLLEIEKNPTLPLTSSRKLKIILAGLDNSGKTSFLLTIDRKYSKLLGLKPTLGAEIKHLETFGSHVFTWDLSGQEKLRDKFLNRAPIYLYDADLIYYFIDVSDPKRIDESLQYFNQILENIKKYEQEIPVLIIISKVDPDIKETNEIKDVVYQIVKKIEEINQEKQLNIEYFLTSIFSVYTILRAYSHGLSLLSPNRKLINFNLSRFSEDIGIKISMLMNEQGLVLADFYSPSLLGEIKYIFSESQPLKASVKSVFEILAPQITNLYKIFERFRETDINEAIYKISPDDIIIIKKTIIENNPMFFLFFVDNEEKNKKIDEFLPLLLEKTQDLIIRYIS